MGRKDPAYLAVGHINKPHGTKGEVFVWPLTDHPESIYAPGVVLSSGPEGSEQPEADHPPLRIGAVRPFRRGFLVSFGGVHDRAGAEALAGRYVFVEASSVEPLAEGEIFYHQLLGMDVFTAAGERIGQISEVYELRPADLLEVRRPGGETVMIPFLSHLVVDVDPEARRMVIDPPEGLLDL